MGRSPGRSSGRSPRLWAYGYADIARLLQTTDEAIRVRSKRGQIQPGDLESICRAWAAARGLVVALTLALALAGGACADAIPADDTGTGGAAAEIGTGGMGSIDGSGAGGTLASGTGGARAGGAGGGGVAGAPGGRGGTGAGGALAGVGGAAAGTGGAAAAGVGGAPGAGGAAGPLFECAGTGPSGRLYSESYCGYLAANGFDWVYMYRHPAGSNVPTGATFRCMTCLTSPGTQTTTECLETLESPVALCVTSCLDDCTY